jgi:uncharacterized protein YdeI (YjbR/CyaY-like superfamily)
MKLIVLMCLFALTTLPFHAQLEIRCETCITHPDSCVIYTHKQDERCLLTFIKVAKQDSIIQLQNDNLQRADSIMYEQLQTIDENETELKRRRKNTFKAGAIGTVSGFFLGLAAFGIALLN